MRKTTARLRRTSISPSSAAWARGSVSRSWLGIRSASRSLSGTGEGVAGGWALRRCRQRIGGHRGGIGCIGLGQQRQRGPAGPGSSHPGRDSAAAVPVRSASAERWRQLARVGEQRIGLGDSGPRWRAAARATSAPSTVFGLSLPSAFCCKASAARKALSAAPDCPPGWRACRPPSARRTGRYRRS